MTLRLAEARRGARAADTRERLLDAAEALFAERGFEGASLRAVTQAAGTSVSAAHYHFGSKEALLRATLWRRVAPINAQRLARLVELQDGAGRIGATPCVEDVLDALLRPALELRRGGADGEAHFRQVVARLYADPPELVAALKRELFGPVIDRFLPALEAGLPGASRAALELAFHFVIGALVHTVGGHVPLESLAQGAELAPTRRVEDDLVRRMVAFAAAGLRAIALSAPACAPLEAEP